MATDGDGLPLSATECAHHQVWIASAFAPSDLPTRYACLLAIADPRVEVAEAAARALRPRAVVGAAVVSGSASATNADGASGARDGASGASTVASTAISRAAAAAAAVPSEHALAFGTRISHVDAHRVGRLGSIAAVHMDDGVNRGAYYTVVLEDGTERSVERSSLRLLS